MADAMESKVAESNETELFAAFVDAIGRPIADLKVKFDTGDNVLELTTDEDGTLPIIDFGGEKKKGQIRVVLPTGKEEITLKFELSLGTNCYLCESPYVLHKAIALRHEGTPTLQEKTEVKPAGAENIVRSKAGNPVVQVTTQDCPNSDNLKLFPNQQHKQLTQTVHSQCSKTWRLDSAGSCSVDQYGSRKDFT